MGAQKKKSKKPSATKAEQLLESAHFIVDECLGTFFTKSLRENGLTADYHLEHFESGTPDHEWLVEIGRRRWISITKDSEMRRNRTEREKVIIAKVRQFTFANGNATGPEMVELFFVNLRLVGRTLKNNQPPFIATISKSGIQLFDHNYLTGS